MFDVITIGGVSRDVFFHTDEGKIINDLKHHQKMIAFEYGSKIIPDQTEFSHGGGGANTAISFAKMGLHTAAILNIGHEGTGSMVMRELEEAGVSCEHITRDTEHHTALSMIISVDDGEHTMFLYRGSNNFIHVDDWRDVHAKWFYLCSLTGESVDLIPEIFSYARAHNIKVAWNPGSEQLQGGYHDMASYLEDTEVLIMNKNEACNLLRSRGEKVDPSDPRGITLKLNGLTPGIVVVTDSEHGSYVSSGDKILHEPAHSTHVVETTGAGDAYGSTFVAGIIQGYGTKHAMKLAAENAASVVSFLGAQKGLMTFGQLSAKIEAGSIDGKEK
jgi:sugar/nucleoside kinase (ribokinase family)